MGQFSATGLVLATGYWLLDWTGLSKYALAADPNPAEGITRVSFWKGRVNIQL